MLTPFSRGAEITIADTLTTDRLGEVSRATSRMIACRRVTLFHRKVTQSWRRRGHRRQAMKALMSAHGALRTRRNVNLGKLLFWPVHRKFGGRIKFLVSGGSALPEDVHKAFHALGFDLAEGYGLTEASPVLSVQAGGNKRLSGSLGKALPGIELRIDSPDGEGIGEVWARGPSVMAGYFGDREATEATLVDGWLRTGDLGRLDDEGRLYLVGRKKDVIIDGSGKNVYPDELEELYGDSKLIKELSVVGLPDEAGGETVACLCVPDYGDRRREEVRGEVEALPPGLGRAAFYRRVKVKLRLWTASCWTSTRVAQAGGGELRRLRSWPPPVSESAPRPTPARPTGSCAGGGSHRQAGERGESRLTADLGFDSDAHRAVGALEAAGVPLPGAGSPAWRRWPIPPGPGLEPGAPRTGGAGESPATESAGIREIPSRRRWPAWAARWWTLAEGRLGGLFKVNVSARPTCRRTETLVIANHTSHLD